MGITGLDFQTVDVKFDQGLDTKTQAKLVLPCKWNQLQNVTLSKDNTPRRRDGITPLVSSANGNGLATYNNQLLVVNGSAVSSVSTASTPAVANPVSGLLGYVGVSKTEVRRSTGMQDSLDCATGGGYTCYVWRDLTGAAVQTGINCTVVDETTGTQLQANATVATTTTGFCPRVVFAGSAFFIFWIDGTFLRCRVIQTSAPTAIGAATALINSASLADLSFDACAFGTNSALVVYGWADGVTSLRSIRVTQAAAVPSIAAGPTNLVTQASHAIATLTAVTCATFSNVLAGAFAMWSTTSDVTGVTINGSWAVVTPMNQLTFPAVVAGNNHLTATQDPSGNVRVYCDQQAAWGTNALSQISAVVVNSTLATTAFPTVLNSASFATAATDPAGPSGPWIAGKAFSTSANVFLPVCVMSNYQGTSFSAPAGTHVTNNMQNTFFLLDVTSTTSAAVVAKALYGAYGVATINNNAPRVSTPCSAPALASGGFALACTERTLLSFVGGFNVSPTGVVRLTLTPNPTQAPIRAQLGESAYFAGGSMTAYDGSGLSEVGFPLFPEGVSVEVVAAGGAMTAGVHQVCVIYEWIDNAGQRGQAAPSLAVSATTAANDRLRVRVPTLLLSQKTGVKIVAYITQAAGLSFNRVGTVTAGSAGTDNDTTVAFVTLPLIDQADSVYAGNELLYNQPNQAGTTLVNNAPGPCSVLGAHQNRLWFDRSDQAGAFGYSQQYVNNLGLQFNETLGGMVDASAGAFTGFQELDEKEIIFCQRKIYAVFGSGPTPSGGFSNYSDPQEIPSDVGCSEPRSILKMPHGIIFKSAKGWYLLGRDLTTRYIGAGVASDDADSVSSAVLLEDRQECRFTISGATNSHSSLTYDYWRDQWSTSQMLYNNGAGSFVYLMADSIWWPTISRYVHVSTSLGLNKDTPGVFLDVGTGGSQAITTTARTGWLHVGTLAGYQRIRWMFLTGTSGSDTAGPTSSLVVSVDFDDMYDGVAPGAYSFSTAMGTAFPNYVAGQSIDLRHKLIRQKCKSVAFTFTDAPIGSAVGANFQALTLEIGRKRGLSKLPATQSVG